MEFSLRLEDEISQQYEVIGNRIGKGAYGIVWQARKRDSGQKVAVKRVFDSFRNVTDAKRCYREILILSHLRHPNIVVLHQVFGGDSLQDVYLIFELMTCDLGRVIRHCDPLDERQCKYVMYQLIRAVDYLHSAYILHRDLKPSNVLCDERVNVKICDFGLAVSVENTSEEDALEEQALSQYVVTRWYRAPEVILKCKSYGRPIDIWSLGCIFVELTTCEVLFKGNGSTEQLKLILSMLPAPTPKELANLGDHDTHLIESVMKCKPAPVTNKRPVNGVIKLLLQENAEYIDICDQCLLFNADDRYTAQQLLNNPFFNEFRHNMLPQPTVSSDVIRILQRHTTSAKKLSIDDLRVKTIDYIQATYT